MAFFKKFGDSAKELKSLRCLATTGLFIAVFIVLKAYVTVPVGQALRISFAYIALAAIGMLYGPVTCMLAAVPCDLLGALLKGDAPLPAFTFIIVFEGLIYGIFLYGYEVKKSFRKNAKLIIAQAIVVFISHLILNTVALYRYGFIGGSESSVIPVIAARAVKNLIEFPVDVALLFLLLVPIKIAYTKVFRKEETIT